MGAGLRWAFGPGTLGRSFLVTCGLAAFGALLTWLATPYATEAGPLGREGHRCVGGRCERYTRPTAPQRPLATFGYAAQCNADEGAERPPWVATARRSGPEQEQDDR